MKKIKDYSESNSDHNIQKHLSEVELNFPHDNFGRQEVQNTETKKVMIKSRQKEQKELSDKEDIVFESLVIPG